MAVESKVEEIFSFVFNLDEGVNIKDSSIENIDGWDSMKQVAIIAAIENEFDIFIEVNEAALLTSYSKIISFLS